VHEFVLADGVLENFGFVFRVAMSPFFLVQLKKVVFLQVQHKEGTALADTF
jgi:hypothetical protein